MLHIRMRWWSSWMQAHSAGPLIPSQCTRVSATPGLLGSSLPLAFPAGSATRNMPCAPAVLPPHCSPSHSSVGGDSRVCAVRPPWALALALGAAAAVPILLLLVRAAHAPTHPTGLWAHNAIATPVGLGLRGRAWPTPMTRGTPPWRTRHPTVPRGQAVGPAGVFWGDGDAARARWAAGVRPGVASRWLPPLLVALAVVVAGVVRAHRRRPSAGVAFGGPTTRQAELQPTRPYQPDAHRPEPGPGHCWANGAAAEGTGTRGQRAVPTVIRAMAVVAIDANRRVRLPPPSPKAPNAVLMLREQLRAGEQHQWLARLEARLPRDLRVLRKSFGTDHVSPALPQEVRDAAAAAPGLETVIGVDVQLLTVLYQAFPFEEPPHIVYFEGHLRHIDDLSLTANYILEMFLTNVESWKGFDRGSDLFISGLGHFHIQEVYNEVLQARRRVLDRVAQALEDELVYALAHPDPAYPIGPRTVKRVARYSAALRWAPKGWLLRPAELQAFAYFPALRQDPHKLQRVKHILEEPVAYMNRVHLIRHRDWWNHLEHANVLDEIESWRGPSGVRDIWPAGGEGMLPPRLLNLLREARRKETLGANTQRLDHLDDLSDVPATPEGTALRVLRDGETVLNVADQLHNCAAGYWRRCCDKRYILAALFDAAGRPLALGGYIEDGGTWSVDQILANRNTQPAPEDRERLERFCDTIRRWSLRQAPP